MVDINKHVFSIDIEQSFIDQAVEKFKEQEIFNVTFSTSDGQKGFAEHAPYDVILLAAGLPFLPDAFKSQLNIGGRLLAFLGEPGNLTATLITRTMNNGWRMTSLFETDMPLLQHQFDDHPFQF